MENICRSIDVFCCHDNGLCLRSKNWKIRVIMSLKMCVLFIVVYDRQDERLFVCLTMESSYDGTIMRQTNKRSSCLRVIMLVTLLVKFRNKHCTTTELGFLLQVLPVRIVTFVETLGNRLKVIPFNCIAVPFCASSFAWLGRARARARSELGKFSMKAQLFREINGRFLPEKRVVPFKFEEIFHYSSLKYSG